METTTYFVSSYSEALAEYLANRITDEMLEQCLFAVASHRSAAIQQALNSIANTPKATTFALKVLQADDRKRVAWGCSTSRKSALLWKDITRLLTRHKKQFGALDADYSRARMETAVKQCGLQLLTPLGDN